MLGLRQSDGEFHCNERVHSCLAKSFGNNALAYTKEVQLMIRLIRSGYSRAMPTLDMSSCPPTSQPPYATGSITSTNKRRTKSSRPRAFPTAFRHAKSPVRSLMRRKRNRRRAGTAPGSKGGGGLFGSRAGDMSW